MFPVCHLILPNQQLQQNLYCLLTPHARHLTYQYYYYSHDKSKT